MLEATAVLSWYLFVECPHCGEQINLVDHDEDYALSKLIFTNKWDEVEGEEIECPECAKSFQIDAVEY